MSSPRRINYKVRIAPIAEKDLAEIYDYVAQDSPRNAAKFFYRLREKVASLKHSPFRCPRIPEKIDSPFEYRHLLVKRYRIIFCVVGEVVWVMRVVHGARLLDLESLLHLSFKL